WSWRRRFGADRHCKARVARRSNLAPQTHEQAKQVLRFARNDETSMQRTTPPFRADHVGSLLRSPVLHAARAQRERAEIDAAALKEIEHREIISLTRRRESAGLKSIPDGEYRRASWQTDFLTALDGVEAYRGERKFKFKGPQPRPILLRLKGKLGRVGGHPMV